MITSHKLVALDEALDKIDMVAAILADLRTAVDNATTMLEEIAVAVESLQDPIELVESDSYASEHDTEDDEEEGDDNGWNDET